METATDCACRCACGGETQVTDSREGPHGSVRRRRRCLACGKRFTTYELTASQAALSLARVREHARRLLTDLQPALAFLRVFREK